MIQKFVKSSRGYSHINENKVCQDSSCLFDNGIRTIIACADGHGGKAYIRSDIGSRCATYALVTALSKVSYYTLTRSEEKDLEKQIKLDVLVNWNHLVDNHLSSFPIRKRELEGLSDEQVESIKSNPYKAYGTTLSGALLIGNKLLVVSIGDTECLGIRKGEIVKLFDDSNEPAGNITYSMCQEDAFNYLRVGVFDFRNFDAVLLCTDGLSSPYQYYDNFRDSFIKPTMHRIIQTKSVSFLDGFVDEVAGKSGVGDDVSLALLVNENSPIRYYKEKDEL